MMSLLQVFYLNLRGTSNSRLILQIAGTKMKIAVMTLCKVVYKVQRFHQIIT